MQIDLDEVGAPEDTTDDVPDFMKHEDAKPDEDEKIIESKPGEDDQELTARRRAASSNAGADSLTAPPSPPALRTSCPLRTSDADFGRRTSNFQSARRSRTSDALRTPHVDGGLRTSRAELAASCSLDTT